MNQQTIGLIVIVIGFIILYIDQYYRYSYNSLPKEKYIYKYIPRSYREELDAPVFPSDIFETMFSLPDPWILGINDLDTRQQRKINQYFISAV